ncbi:MAG TPA: C25 family cysteine peptidase, partial [Segetibacter sp.]
SEYVYSSAYDMGEMWSTGDIYPSTPVSVNFEDLYVASTGPDANFAIAMAGSAHNNRQYKVDVNNTKIIDTSISSFDARINSNPAIPLSVISSATNAFKITNSSANVNDRIVCNSFQLTYPRKFNFGNEATFAFSLPANNAAQYLEITNFAAGAIAPVLYDLVNMRRYVADVSTAGMYKFVVQPSTVTTNLVLVAQTASTAKNITAFQQRLFINYTNTQNQGDYIIITHPSLQLPYSGADQVQQYMQYRSSAVGGGYNAKIYDVDQLVDQFGYGIKKNPLSIKNFLRFARSRFSVAPKFAFIIGRGLTYAEYSENEKSPFADKMNLVPTWGYPASDVMLASNTLDPVMNTLISRLSVITPREIADYLDKVKQYERAQQNPNQSIDNKAWMKNIAHVVGANDLGLDQSLTYYMKNYQAAVEDSAYGARVTNFNKTSTGPVTPIVSTIMSSLFEKGLSMLTYFGHSSASSLDYNLDDPSAYNNTGKYPLFCVSGCNAGNLYSFDTSRFSFFGTLSEKYVLTKDKGAIGFIASTHFGIDTYLDYYNRNLYNSITGSGYGKSITYNMNEAIIAMNAFYGTDFIGGRLHSEEITLHGDPALKMNSFTKPDFVIEDPQVIVDPNILSVADAQYTVKAQVYNIGKVTGDSVLLQIRHQFPGGGDTLIYNKRIRSIRFTDSISIKVPIDAIRDKGDNKIIVSLDTDNRYDELSESNNTASKTFTIFEDELTPVYPYNFAIVNRTNFKLAASTANPLVASRQYMMEIDTTEKFNSSLKVNRTVAATGGLIEFDPGIGFTDSTVYYWRVAPATTTSSIRWNTASFTYISGTNTGFNQSHFYQHTKSKGTDISIDSSSRKWKFNSNPNNITVVNSVFLVSGDEDSHFNFSVNGIIKSASACVGHSVIFVVFDPVTLQPLYNQATPATTQSGVGGSFMGSSNNSCGPLRDVQFEFSYLDTTGRRKMRDFLDWVPSGYYVAMRSNLDPPYDQNPYVDAWKNDESVYGVGNSLYSRLKSAGFADLDNYTYPRIWSFIYRKNMPSFSPMSKMSTAMERITLGATINLSATVGYISSPVFGPAKAWKQVKWRGASVEAAPKDVYSVNIIGITASGREDTLYRLQPNQQDFDISAVNATTYPNIRLGMKNQDLDTAALTPYQLRYWRLFYEPVPEGALAPNIVYNMKDTLEVGEKLDFSIAFKNISDAAFADSLKVNMVVFDKNNVGNVIPVSKLKKLQIGDTARVTYSIDTKAMQGSNTLYVDVNPTNSQPQPEQSHFNNFLYKNFTVKADAYNPAMDVTFDGVHILNGDIVSAKPKIIIKLRDEAKYLALDDTSLATVYVRYPGNNGALQRIAFGTDTLKFIPADLSSGKNEATVEFTPAF